MGSRGRENQANQCVGPTVGACPRGQASLQQSSSRIYSRLVSESGQWTREQSHAGTVHQKLCVTFRNILQSRQRSDGHPAGDGAALWEQTMRNTTASCSATSRSTRSLYLTLFDRCHIDLVSWHDCYSNMKIYEFMCCLCLWYTASYQQLRRLCFGEIYVFLFVNNLSLLVLVNMRQHYYVNYDLH